MHMGTFTGMLGPVHILSDNELGAHLRLRMRVFVDRRVHTFGCQPARDNTRGGEFKSSVFGPAPAWPWGGDGVIQGKLCSSA